MPYFVASPLLGQDYLSVTNSDGRSDTACFPGKVRAALLTRFSRAE